MNESESIGILTPSRIHFKIIHQMMNSVSAKRLKENHWQVEPKRRVLYGEELRLMRSLLRRKVINFIQRSDKFYCDDAYPAVVLM